ncbi:MAG TPA: hypothetical protein VJ508_18560 [Saprospiraceae bacterium]|nr:hypothetical protein [Saprospiraceae bacterium]
MSSISGNNVLPEAGMVTEVASPVAFFKADQALQQQIKQTVLDKVGQKNDNGHIALESNAIVICGEK